MSISPAFSQIARSEAYEAVKHTLGTKWTQSEVFVTDRTLMAGEQMATLGAAPVKAKTDSWMFFIDLDPYANWGHECIYAFVDVNSFQVDTLHRLMPPLGIDRMEQIKQVLPRSTSDQGALFDIPAPQNPSTPNNGYAVIISGGASPYYNFERYWNDCSAMYKVLRNKYNYSRDKIFVLMSDGTDPGEDMHLNSGGYISSPLDLDNDGYNDIQYSATKANITTVFNILQQLVTANDNVFIFTTDHGGSGSTLNLWGESMTTTEFAAEVNKLSAAKSINVCMEQCFSGGYIAALCGDKRVVATACSATQSSYAMSDLRYDEFCYYWISAVAGYTPDGTPVNADYNDDGHVSMDEAFLFAQSHDTRPETPQYCASQHPNLGPYLTLAGIINHQVDLMVRDDVNDQGQIPSGATIMWNSPDIWLEDLNGTPITNPHGNTTCNVCVKVTNIGTMPTYGEERLFLNWAKAGCDLRWDHNWNGNNHFNCTNANPLKGAPIGNPAGVVIPIIEAGNSAVVKVQWNVPRAEDYQSCTQFASELWHFCLVARVHDDEPIYGESASNLGMGTFTVQNNNVAWKNVSILSSRYNSAVVSVSNPEMMERGITLQFTTEPDRQGEWLFDYADVFIRLDDELVKSWKESGARCVGGRYDGENKFFINEKHFALDGISLPGDRHYTLEAGVQFYTQAEAAMRERRFVFDITEWIDGELVGAERFIAIRDNTHIFQAVALGDREAFAGGNITLTAEDIGEPAQYIWRTLDGTILAEGLQLNLTVQGPQVCLLEVIADADGYKDFDTVHISVIEGAIINLAPNPSNHQTFVAYRLADGVTGAMLTLTNAAGRVVYSAPLTSGAAGHTLNLQSLPEGHYVVSLVAHGVTLDSKTLVVY